MTPVETLKALIDDFDSVRYEYREFGAGDTEIGCNFRRAMRNATKGILKVPTSGDAWELYTASKKCGKATRALSASARKVCNHIIKYRDSVALQSFCAGYDW
jgi:hypothetical protein